MNTIEDFINYLIEKAGLNDVDPEILDDYHHQLGMELTKRISIASLVSLPKEYEDQFINEIAPQDDPNKTLEFFNAHIENYNDVITKVLSEFEEQFLANFVKEETAESSQGQGV